MVATTRKLNGGRSNAWATVVAARSHKKEIGIGGTRFGRTVGTMTPAGKLVGAVRFLGRSFVVKSVHSVRE
jgi:hypothetical protein